MKTIFKTTLAVCFLAVLTFSCKQAAAPAEEAPVTEAVSNAEISAPATDSMQYEKNRKFIRTADLKFKVKNVAFSTEAIEDVTHKFGGMVTNTNLHSDISERKETKISLDSARVNTKYTTENEITIRIPNTRLDTVVKSISRQVEFLDARNIKADDVSLQFLANQMARQRSQEHGNRLVKAIDNKGTKLNQIVAAEDDLATKKQLADDNQVMNLTLKDEVDFSTLTLEIYQPETVRSETIAVYNVPRPNVGFQLLEALRDGWYLLEGLLAFVVQLWSLIVLALLGIWLYQKHVKKLKPVS